ncbi:peptidase dimerization domain-containing protein [Arthrobacter sp. FW306-2-2C-D06B]|uniref:peptidase dimerization domain-containing protein n=1 Tax=Arthrobacter sp. FW306-2-2C-D06B TaxID=2879618 RepID=UPI001F42B902|nr:peptidase dimerization domain-containing protein [Arthrobacter sp. FW306-2-2C-D06B]
MSVDPVVLASSIVLRLQSTVSRETKPGDFAVVTVGALNAGATSNIVPDRATLLLNIRTYDAPVRASVLAAIERIVKGECCAAGSPQDPDFEYYDQFSLTSNDAAVTEKVRAAFSAHFGADSPLFAPVIDPALSIGVQTHVVAAVLPVHGRRNTVSPDDGGASRRRSMR